MSVESSGSGTTDGRGIGPCRNAEEYVVEALKSQEGTVSPADLADAYGCTPGHMQDVLRESDSTTRVEIGEYALSTETPTGAKAEAEDTLSDVDRDEFAGVVASDDAGDEERETAVEGGDEEESDGPNGIPVPVPPNVLIIAAVGIFLLAFLRGIDSTSSEPDSRSNDNAPEEADRISGLIQRTGDD